MTVKIHCDGCETILSENAMPAIDGKRRIRMYHDQDLYTQPIGFDWCDLCADVALKAVREANGR